MKNKILFWAIGIFGLAWNGMGILNFIMQQNPVNMAQMPPLFQAIVEARPLWATVAFGIAVAGGGFGCVFLLLRQKIAIQIFLISLIAMIAHMFSYLSVKASFGFGDIMLIGIAPFLVSIGLWWWSRRVLK
jgi:hypothetical protein